MTPRIFDLHCDLLSYLANRSFADPFDPDLGCSIPHLRAGKVRLQVCAIYTNVVPESPVIAEKQARIFAALPKNHPEYFYLLQHTRQLDAAENAYKTGLLAAIENAAGLANESEALEKAFERLDRIHTHCGGLLYISFTHHGENRFGGGNYTTAGLKEDGKALLDYMSGKGICIDLSHTSDALAEGILEHMELNNLDITPIASHSNFRAVWDHPRNLSDELARAIIAKGGLIGLNFVRAFLHDDSPEALYAHIRHGLALGAEDHLAFGADFFYTADHPDPSRQPFYHPEHGSASVFPALIEQLRKQGFSDQVLQKLSYGNFLKFLESRV